ncbi:hypothetical protein BJX65DRAFT_265417 [Aspergillus insuetus]
MLVLLACNTMISVCMMYVPVPVPCHASTSPTLTSLFGCFCPDHRWVLGSFALRDVRYKIIGDRGWVGWGRQSG